MAQKRRKFMAQFKFETVMEVLCGEKSVVQICQERAITETLYYKWRDAFSNVRRACLKTSAVGRMSRRRRASPSWSG
jgi:transposase-like protein